MTLLRKIRSPSGPFYAILAAVLFGASAPAAKWLLSGASPWLLAGLLYLGSGVGLLLLRGLQRLVGRSRREAPLRGRDWLWLASATVFGGVIGPVLLMLGLARTQAATASLLLNLEGVFTALLAWFAFRENFDRRIMLGMIAILVGSLFLSWTGVPGLSGSVGPLCVAGACLAWGLDNNLTKKVSGTDPLQIAMTKGLAAGVVNTTLAMLVTSRWPDRTIIIGAMSVGFFGYGVSLLCFVLGLRHVGAARTGAYFSLAPFVGSLIALAMGEPLTWKLGIAATFMGAGVWLHLTERHSHNHVHEEMEHEHLHFHDEHHQHVHTAGDPAGEPHSHRHRHTRLVHTHPHFPDLHHTHTHA